MMLAAVPLAALALLYESRGWFLILISCVFLYIYIKRSKGRKIAFMEITGVIAILLVFFISSFDKYSDVNSYLSKNNIKIMTGLTYGYFVSPPVAFLNWVTSNYKLENGK